MGAGSIVLRWITACVCAALGCAAQAAAAQVAVVTRAPEDRDVAAQLDELLPADVSRRQQSGEPSIAQMMNAAADWPERYVLVIDRAEHTVYALRPRERTFVARVLGADVMRDARRVALAAAELLEWSGVLPAARGRPAPQRPASTAAAPVDAPVVRTEPEPPPSSSLGWGFGADLELAMHPGHDVSLARVSISGELQLGRRRGPTWFAFGARLGGPAAWDRELTPAQAPGVMLVEYSDVVTALHAALGYGAGRATVLAQLEGGLTFVLVEAFAPDRSIVAAHDGTAAFVGLGVGLRYPLVWGLSIAAGVQAHWLAERMTYRALDAVVLEEGPIRVATRIGVIWESALFGHSP